MSPDVEAYNAAQDPESRVVCGSSSWSGQSFEERGLASEGSFKAAEARYVSSEQIDRQSLRRWLTKSKSIQWDYKNIVKRKGRLERLWAS